MKKYHVYLVLALLISFFIYVFYRTDKTVINQILIFLFSQEQYDWARSSVREFFAPNKYLIYSLPEGLWVFCITITSRYFYVQIGHFILNCAYIPILFAVGLEVLQLLDITPGRCDSWDICFSLFFWMLGLMLDGNNDTRVNLLSQINFKSLLCLSNYAIVYLAHVKK